MVFDEYAAYYDLLYRDKDYVGEAEYIDKLLRSAVENRKLSILELGCGTGKHATLLNEKGHTVYGIERSEEMLQKAKVRAQGRKGLFFQQADITDFCVEKEFDAVIALFHVMSYQNREEDFLQVLNNAYKELRVGGIFLFDTWYGPAVLWEKPELRVKRIEAEKVAITRIAEPVMRESVNIVDVQYTVFVQDKKTKSIYEIQEKHSMRYWFKNEVERLSKMAGFSLRDTFEFMTGNELSCHTWGSCYILRREDD